MRTYTKTLSAIFLIPLLAIIGCGDDNNNTTGGSGGNNSGSIDDVRDKIVDAFCATAVDCRRAETDAECRATTRIEFDSLKYYVDNGTVKYNADKLDACIAELKKNLGCSYSTLFQSEASALDAACNPVFDGTIADGGDCFIDEQCVSSECEAVDPNCADACCAGKCVVVPPPPPVAKIGEACGELECESGAYCQSDMAGNPTTCAAETDVGQACTDPDGCKAPGVCDFDFATGMGTCYLPAPSGAACKFEIFFSCDRLDEFCDPTTMKCTPKATVGGDCTASDCVDYAYCDPATNKCAKDLAEGATCDDATNECLGDLSCTNGKCTLEADVVCK